MDMNLQIVENPKFGKVRFQMIDGDPWFSASDVCNILGYANARDALAKHVAGDDVAKCDAIDNLGRTQKTNFINESGLYSLIFGSTLPIAKEFKRWVTSEVLPSIRKNGFYMTLEKAEQVINDPDVWIGVLNELKRQRAYNQKLIEKNNDLYKDNCEMYEDNCQMLKRIEELEAQIEFESNLSKSENLISVNECSKIAQQNGVPYGEKTLFSKLREDGFLCSSKNMWNLPTQRAVKLGLFKVVYFNHKKADGSHLSRGTTKVTHHGLQWIIRHYREKINRLLAEAREEGVY